MARGELVGAIAMTEPGAGSDLQGVRTRAELRDGRYLINGSKTFITNGLLAGLVLVVCKTDPTQGARGTSILIVETRDCKGFRVGRVLDKMGMKAQDTSELFFDDVAVPQDALLGGREGQGFYTLTVGRAFIDRCVEQLVAGTLDTATASMAKLWGSEAQGRVLDELVQLHGGYGFMNEYMVTRMYADARVQRIYGGTSEIMKEVIARAL
jgi:acyl-CoA dehydrogenase